MAVHIPNFQGVCTHKWKYIRYVTGEEELYDLVNDPYVLEILADEAECVQLTMELSALLESYTSSQ